MSRLTGLLTPALLLCALAGAGCSPEGDKTPPGAATELVFQSGFEGTTQVVPRKGQADDIVGAEPILDKSDWDALQRSGGIESVWINYTGGDETKRFAKIVPEPGAPDNKVLQFWLNDSWSASENQIKARIQLEFHSISRGLKEFRQSVRVFLTEDFNALKTYPKAIKWCTISEFWNNEWWVAGEKHGFRITLGVGKEKAGDRDLHFILNAEDQGMVEVWKADNPNVKVPIGKWFTMDYYFKEGDRSTGRFHMTITPDGEAPQVVFDVQNFTHMTKDTAPNGVTGYNPLKLYTSKEVVAHVKAQGKTLQIFWDDLKVWRKQQP
jgi:hypothetical protein